MVRSQLIVDFEQKISVFEKIDCKHIVEWLADETPRSDS